MAYVFRIRNKVTGSLQIDNTRPNLALLATGVAVSSAGAGIHGNVATFDVASSSPLLFAIRSTGFAAIAHVEQVSGAQRAHIYTQNAGQSVAVYAFGRPIHQGSGNALVVRTLSGDVTFDSRMKYARAAGVFDGDYSAGPLTLALPAGRTYAAMPVRKSGWNRTWGVRVEEGAGDPTYAHYQLHGERLYSGVRFNGLEAQITPGVRIYNGFLGLISTIGYPTLYQEQPAFAWLILDVTGY